ncbi:diguanylate cyclase domain-containing protein [Pseudanabaena sp. Chao 1811]|uniref:diguanylate cyclase domain-containing protein n=1 Tax=Pseudanabaena sp. Chao 1811 TaxID=2963092 RepID=UPI0022F3DAA5|nr:diguanylate cyclase [Pseudanabaena sp. Chao 1811]
MFSMVDDELIIADELEFADEVDQTLSESLESWKVLIVDDEVEIHNITRLALEDFSFDNKSLKFLSAYSGTDARQIMKKHPDIAVTLLDVIMESDDAGLITAKYIRETLQNRAIRIILRTGQPGQAPERQVIVDYDIDDYKTKTEFTSQKLFTAIITALRSYKAYTELESLNSDLERRVEDRTIKLQDEINKRREIENILSGILNSSLDGIVALKSIREPTTAHIESFRCLMINPIIVRAFNANQEELIGKLVSRKFLNNIEPDLFDRFVQVVETGQPLEQDFYYPWGDSYWYQFASVKLDDGLAVTVRDITARKKIELALQESNQKLESLVNIDGLTKVANRRCFDIRLQEEWNRLARKQQLLSLIIFDLDFFKFYNDYYGHLAGDDCLERVAQSISKAIDRAGDLVARYGGEEFVVLLPSTDLDGAISVAQRMQQIVQDLAIPHQQSSVSSIVTISLGIASMMPTIEGQANRLIEQADQALYKAKQQGRDRYCT